MILEFKNICKNFGNHQVLKDISFKVESSKAMAYLGRNGAGKTTSIRALMDVFKPDSGEFLIDKKTFHPKNHKIGYLPEERGMYNKIPILDQLIYFAKLRGMDTLQAKKNALRYLETVELEAFAEKELGTLSKGNQQKIQLIQTVIHKPEILILDEPFSGLDPVNSKILQNIVLEYINTEALVFFSSHQMSLIEEICEYITFIKNGEIIVSRSLADLKAEGKSQKLRLKVEGMNTDDLGKLFSERNDIEEISKDKISHIIKYREHFDKNNFLSYLLDKSLNIQLFSEYEPSLQDIYIKYLGNEENPDKNTDTEVNTNV